MKGIVEIFGDIVEESRKGLSIKLFDMTTGVFNEESQPHVSYIFGNSRYVKEQLDIYSKSVHSSDTKLPLVALFTPAQEDRGVSSGYFSKVSLSIVIACSTTKEWNNEERLEYSFIRVLRPIYRRILEALQDSGYFDIEYDGRIPHRYSENYSYGRYGAFTDDGQEVSEPIDAIVIRSMELKIRNDYCRP